MGSPAGRLFRRLIATGQQAVRRNSNGIPSTSKELQDGPSKINVEWGASSSSVRLQSAQWSQPLLLHATWLRDHCRCPSCYNELTNHKMVDIAAVGLDIKPQSVQLLEGTNLQITWPDGHRSIYDVRWLQENVYEGYQSVSRAKKILWGGMLDSMSVTENVVKYDDYMNDEDALKTVLRSLVHRGFAMVQKVPQTLEATQAAAERICPIRLGFFGKILELQSNMLHRSTGSLEKLQQLTPHTDQSYLPEPAGVKMVNCLNTNAKMYVSFVDGFNVANELRKRDPEAYRALSELPLIYEYTDDAFHHKCLDFIIKHDPLTDGIMQIKYNMYYRSGVAPIPFEDMDRFYSALHAFSQLLLSSNHLCRIQPVPGTLMIADNWRILSNSTGCDSGVKMAGCYLGWSDYMCRARRLGVVP